MFGFGKKREEQHVSPTQAPAAVGTKLTGLATPLGEARRYKIIYYRDKCIGADVCTPIAPKLVKMNPADNKVDLIGGTEVSPGVFEVVVQTDMTDMNNPFRRACDSCPAGAFKAVDLETGEKVAGH